MLYKQPSYLGYVRRSQADCHNKGRRVHSVHASRASVTGAPLSPLFTSALEPTSMRSVRKYRSNKKLTYRGQEKAKKKTVKLSITRVTRQWYDMNTSLSIKLHQSNSVSIQ